MDLLKAEGPIRPIARRFKGTLTTNWMGLEQVLPHRSANTRSTRPMSQVSGRGRRLLPAPRLFCQQVQEQLQTGLGTIAAGPWAAAAKPGIHAPHRPSCRTSVGGGRQAETAVAEPEPGGVVAFVAMRSS